MRRTALLSILYGFLALSFQGCTFHSAHWTSTNPAGSESAAFQRFNGTEEHIVHATEGEHLFVSASAALSSGSLKVSVMQGRQKLWERTFSATNDWGHFDLAVLKAATYTAVIQGQDAAGSYRITYESAPGKEIQVRVNRNIELFGLLLQLDLGADALANTDVVELDGRKAQWRDWYRLAVQNYQRYRRFADGRMMKLYREYAARGFYNDFLIGLLLQVDEVPKARLRADTDREVVLAFAKDQNAVAAEKTVSEFLEALNAFYQEIHFDAFLDEQKAAYIQIRADVTKHLPAPAFIATMESFYGKGFHQYCLVPSLTIPTSMGFGKMHQQAGTIYNTFGPFTFQDLDKNPPSLGFDQPDKVLNLSVHEFGHSFVNPSIDRVPSEVIQATEPLFAPIRESMSKQAYPSWRICLYEHFVRAGEVVIARKLGQPDQANRILRDNAARQFIYLPQIVSELEAFDCGQRGEVSNYDLVVRNIISKLKQPPVP